MKTRLGEKSEGHSARGHLASFLFWTVATLFLSVAALLVLNMYFQAAGDEIGNLGGAFQGTLGVAAALAGALVTIKLAVIAIDQSEKTQDLARQQNEIAERQARNDDPDYQSARSAAAFLQRIFVVRTLVAANKKRIEDYNEGGAVGVWLNTLPPEHVDFSTKFMTPHLIRFLSRESSSDEIFVNVRHLDESLQQLKTVGGGDGADDSESLAALCQEAIDAADKFLSLLISIIESESAGVEPGYWTYLSGEIPRDIKGAHGLAAGAIDASR